MVSMLELRAVKYAFIDDNSQVIQVLAVIHDEYI